MKLDTKQTIIGISGLLIILAIVNYTTSMYPDPKLGGKPIVEKFEELGNDKSFQEAHLSPGKDVFANANNEIVKIKCKDGLDANAYYVSKNKDKKYILMFHEWWGLNEYIKKEAQKWADSLNINVIAVDLYDGKVADNPDAATKIMQGMDEKRAKIIIRTIIRNTGDSSEIATVGWCFGGGWSLQAAILGTTKSKACVMYYGMPEKDIEKLKTLNCPVMGIFGTKDEWINPTVVKSFEANMKQAGKSLTVKNYDAVHAFANPSNPDYDKTNAEDAFRNAVVFIKENLK